MNLNIKTGYKMAMPLLMLMMFGCALDTLDEKPPHLITTNTLYTSLAGFETGLNGLYGLVRQEREGSEGATLPYTSNPNALRVELAMNGTDNMCTNVADRFSIVASLWGERNSPGNVQITSNFIWLYTTVNAANTIINQAERGKNNDWTGGGGNSETNKNRVIAEAKALRAWAYRHLTYGWGDVPLNLEESLGSTIKTDWERAPVAVVRKQIISDLAFAEKHIPVEPAVRGKISRGAVQHYLSEMYLVMNKPDSALYWANQVINNPAYKIKTARYGKNANAPGVAFMDMFQDGNSNREEGNTEALWVWQFANGIGGGVNIMRRWHMSQYDLITIGGVRPLKLTVERGGRGVSRFTLTKWAIDLYEPQDERGSNFAIRKFFTLNNAAANAPWPADLLPPGYAYGDMIKMNWSQPITPTFNSRADWPYSRKFDGTDPANPSGSSSFNDQVYLRLAETYLLKAEAQLLLGSAAGAAETINVLRRRAHASEVDASKIDIDFILDERSRELVLEEHRRYTLLRTGKWLERTKLHNLNGGQFITERDKLYPIPKSVIDANLTKKMTQNPGFL
ncbi:hypothetical protein AAE02nite_13960 [Adhaeribacter aerolatus]|uniref:Starch-binding protein n=1 Tax=Adhaeribacter aerolatus TaxID=670289 RepID=A0A512AVJ1_9BACT|nr:RagB/SusD family nutrient uptake outer membrane protein [Adhaeribacter aerolatus]GEO03732.1 hypothetical protein AAE02nite_13960 [Adhaeribacter aerolatus]